MLSGLYPNIRQKQFRGAKIDDLRLFVETHLNTCSENYKDAADSKQKEFSHGQLESLKSIHTELMRVFYKRKGEN